jgi:hypothetical protein
MDTLLNTTYIDEISLAEQIALVKAFRMYVLFTSKSKKFPTQVKTIRSSLDTLIEEFLPVFIKNQSVKEKLNSSSRSSKENFSFNADELRTLHVERDEPVYKINRNYRTSRLKGRLVIFGLEVLGFFVRPQVSLTNFSYHAIVQDVFSGNVPSFTNIELSGFYQVFRLSFNNSFPGHVAAYLIEIYKDPDHPSIYRYRSSNKYIQKQGSDKHGSMKRARMSDGYIYNYQGQMLFFGGVTYSHVHKVDAVAGLSVEEKDKYDNYPEIMMFHPHGGDVLNIRGLMLAHYPLLSMPVATRAYLSSITDLDSDVDFDSLLAKKYDDGTPFYYGNVDPKTSDTSHPLISSTQNALPFIINKIENTYSQMLTP